MRAGIVGLSGATLLLLGCVSVPEGEPRTETKSIGRGEAEMVRADIEMKAGELRISGGASQLLDATFHYNDDRWQPEVRYDLTGFRGNLVVRQPKVAVNIGPSSGFRHEWDLRLNNDVPLDLNVTVGAGKSLLELGALYLRGLDVHLGAGELELDLTGKWRKDLEARIRGGVGKATIRLPRDVGVRAFAKGGIGEIKAAGFHRSGHTYTNDAFEHSPVTLRLDIQGGIGEIRLELAG